MITYDNSDTKLVIQTEPVASYEGFITLMRGGKEIGRIDAKFDFSQMPDFLHEIALNCILGRGVNLYLPAHNRVFTEKAIKEKPQREDKSLLNRFFNWKIF